MPHVITKVDCGYLRQQIITSSRFEDWVLKNNISSLFHILNFQEDYHQTNIIEGFKFFRNDERSAKIYFSLFCCLLEISRYYFRNTWNEFNGPAAFKVQDLFLTLGSDSSKIIERFQYFNQTK